MSPANWYGEFLLPVEVWSGDTDYIWNTDRDLRDVSRKRSLENGTCKGKLHQ